MTIAACAISLAMLLRNKVSRSFLKRKSNLMKLLLSFILVTVSYSLSAQSYNITLVPDSLKKDARAIVREDEFILEIKSPAKAVTKEHHVYTILNERGDNIGGYTSFYGKFNSINSI